MTSAAPKARATWAAMMPIGPAPAISTRWPGTTRDLRSAAMPTLSGSQSAAASSEKSSGTAKANIDGAVTYSVNAPSTGGVAKNSMFGHRL